MSPATPERRDAPYSSPHRDRGIDAQGATRREMARQRRDQQQHRGARREGRGVERVGVEQERAGHPREREGARRSDRDPDGREAHRVADDEPGHVPRRRPDGDADARLAPALDHRVWEHAVHARGRERDRQRDERAEQRGVVLPRRDRAAAEERGSWVPTASGGEDPMRKSRFSDEQIIAIVRAAEGGKGAEVCRRHGVSRETLRRWRTTFRGMEVQEARRLEALEDENGRLEKLVADQALDLSRMKARVGRRW